MMPLLLGLLGCQTTGDLIPLTTTGGSGPACYVDDDQLTELLDQQYRYQQAGGNNPRLQQLAAARQNGNKALEGLLLTSPASSPEQVTRGAALLGSLPLYPDAHCMADRYLYLHLGLVRQGLGRQTQLNAKNTEIVELKRKIEALTDLEQQITRQRKDL
ncbi:hypothetical protein [Marinobacterium aestuariivivens]